MNTDIDWLKRMLSHNVRMPMSIIMGYGELLKQGLLSAEEQQDIIQNICENISYMNDVLKVVLDEDAIDENTQTDATDVVEILFRSAAFVNEVARKIPIQITIKTEKQDMYVTAKEVSLMRIFYHLFENALKYLRPYDEIHVNAYYVGEDQVLIVFKDNGKGMPEKETKHILEKGYRGNNSKGKPGSGYGLHEVKWLMEECGGTVTVSSRENGGFSVYLILPTGCGA